MTDPVHNRHANAETHGSARRFAVQTTTGSRAMHEFLFDLWAFRSAAVEYWRGYQMRPIESERLP
jgi:hypothetical protein